MKIIMSNAPGPGDHHGTDNIIVYVYHIFLDLADQVPCSSNSLLLSFLALTLAIADSLYSARLQGITVVVFIKPCARLSNNARCWVSRMVWWIQLPWFPAGARYRGNRVLTDLLIFYLHRVPIQTHRCWSTASTLSSLQSAKKGYWWGTLKYSIHFEKIIILMSIIDKQCMKTMKV